MINRQLSRLLLCSILGSTTLISGCALVRKDSAPHQQLKPEQIKLADDIHLASSGWPQAQWWKQLNDPQLDALIQRTLSGSHTLAEAKLREEKAQSQADLLDAGSQLQVAALGMLNRQRVSANGFLSPYSMDAPALGMDGPYYTEATVGLFAGLDLDLWGVHRSAVAAAIGAHNAALAETAAVELSLATGVAQLYYSMQASYQMLDLLEQTHDVIDYAVKAHQNAVRDVAVNGTRLQTLNDEREMQAERVEATRFTQRAAEAAYQCGLTSRLQATEARLPVLAEEMSLLMLDSRRVIQSIQLMKSLGGGYQAGPVVEKK
ncbi:TolC family protein [Escherichia coli]|nr:TolC family protein [Escherichia coli]